MIESLRKRAQTETRAYSEAIALVVRVSHDGRVRSIGRWSEGEADCDVDKMICAVRKRHGENKVCCDN